MNCFNCHLEMKTAFTDILFTAQMLNPKESDLVPYFCGENCMIAFIANKTRSPEQSMNYKLAEVSSKYQEYKRFNAKVNSNEPR